MIKPTIRIVRPAKTQISLLIACAFYSLKAIQRGITKTLAVLSDISDIQADLCLCWLHRSYCRFCHALAQKLWVLRSA